MIHTNQSPITIIIVNWNSGAQLVNCVNSIVEHGAGVVNQIIVVDNGSTDGSDFGIDGFPNVTLIRVGSNLGFGKACNLGAHQAQSDYLLFLNPDAILYAETLPKVLDYMENPENASVGICGVQLFDENDNISFSCSRFPSVQSQVSQSAGLDRLFPQLSHLMLDFDHMETREVDHVIGAFLFIRRVLFSELGGFDERFFVYFEDIDLSLRANLAGWRSIFIANACAFHAGGGTSKQIKARRLFFSLRSRLQYAFAHFSLFGALSVLLAILLIEPISRSVLSVARSSWSGLRETFVAYGMLWFWLMRLLFRDGD